MTDYGHALIVKHEMNNLSTVSSLRADVARLRLIGRDLVLALPTDTLAAAYNGTGPEFLPQRIRQKLDALARPLLPSVMVHDVDFTFSDGSRLSFLIANQHLFWNCIICACDAHPWYSLRRYALILESWALYRACAKFGWIAWLLAYNKNTQKKGTTNE